MLEIAILYVMSKNIGDIVQAKGRMRIGYQLLLWLFWFGGELCGAFAGGALSVAGGGDEPNLILVYGCALAGAVVGAVLAFAIAKGVPSLKADDDFYRRPSGYGRGLPDRTAESWAPAAAADDDRIRR
jgi:hypothetical protein